MSVVLDLQNDAMNREIKVSDLLIRSYVIAKKLEIKEFEIFINLELNGYDGVIDKLPNYRLILGELVASRYPFPGYIPFAIHEPSLNGIIRTARISKPLSEIENYYDDMETFIIVKLAPEIINFLNQYGDTRSFVPEIHLYKPQIQGILDSVRMIILDWTLELEKDDILGENLTFSSEEKAKANEHVTNYINIINSQLQVNTLNSTQNMQINTENVETLMESINDSLDELELSSNDVENVRSEIENIKSQLESSETDNSIIIRGLKTIGRIMENSSGNLLAEGIKLAISSMIGASF